MTLRMTAAYDHAHRTTSHLQGGQETSVSEDLGGTASLRARYAKDHNPLAK